MFSLKLFNKRIITKPLLASMFLSTSTDFIDTIAMKERSAENIFIREKEKMDRASVIKIKEDPNMRGYYERKHNLPDCYEFAENEEEETTLLNEYLTSPLNLQNCRKVVSPVKLPYEDMLNFAKTDVDAVLLATVSCLSACLLFNHSNPNPFLVSLWIYV